MYVFRAWHSMPNEFHDADGWPTNAVHGFARFLLELLERERPRHIAIAFDEALDSCFRNALYPAYKANRESAPEELKRQFAHCKALCRALGLAVLAHSDYEADDLIGTRGACRSRQRPSRRDRVRRQGSLAVARRPGRAMGLREERALDHGGREGRGMASKRTRSPTISRSPATRSTTSPACRASAPKTAAILLAHFGSLDALLARVDEVTYLRIRGAAQVAVKLRANKEQALLWRQLTTIALDAPLSQDAFHRGQADGAALIGLCESLRFGPLTRRRLQEISNVQTHVTVAG